MSTAYGPGCDPGIAFGQSLLDGPVLPIFAGAAIYLPMTWWQVPPVYGSDGVTVITAGVPVNMTGMQPGAEFLTYGQRPGQGMPLAISSFVPLAATWIVTGPGQGQAGDLTSGLASPSPANLKGPRVRMTYVDASNNPQVFGTYYLQVR